MGVGDHHSTPTFSGPERDSAPFEQVEFSPEQQVHVHLMRHIAQEITRGSRSNFILKGGTALLLAYGLPRFSEDLDFDGRYWHLDPTRNINRGADRASIPLHEVKRTFATETKRKHKVNYLGHGHKDLKVEFSYRQTEEIDEDDVIIIDGIRVYTIEKIARQKIKVLGERTKPRDLFDVSFITQYYPEAISDQDLLALAAYIAERGMNWIEEQMLEDPVLDNYEVDHVAMVLCDNVARMKEERGI